MSITSHEILTTARDLIAGDRARQHGPDDAGGWLRRAGDYRHPRSRIAGEARLEAGMTRLVELAVVVALALAILRVGWEVAR